jgi:hypothetical protein
MSAMNGMNTEIVGGPDDEGSMTNMFNPLAALENTERIKSVVSLTNYSFIVFINRS